MEFKKTPLWDSSLSVEERLTYLLANMTLEEKIGFLSTKHPALKRLGISSFGFGGEAAHGIEARHDQEVIGEPEFTTSFPQPIGMSASWNTELIEKAGRITGTEARVLFNRNPNGGLSRWAPTVDMERDSRWGRTEEGYGEDPYLTGKMASAYIQGLQGRDPEALRMAASVKHFYGNNVEDGRVWKSSSIDPRNKYEYYLEPFRRTIEEGNAEAMMTAYNEINGIPAILNHEVNTLVKGKWKMRGHVVCDGGDMLQTVDFHHYYGTHAETVAEGLKAGIDCFTDDSTQVEMAVREAYALGLIDEEDIDRALRNTFGTKIRLGLYDAVPKNPYIHAGENDILTEESREINKKISEESIVLLKNKEGFLPLKEEENIVLLGPLADVWYKDWYGGEPPYRTTLNQGIKDLLGHEIPCESGLLQIYICYQEKYVGLDDEHRPMLVDKKEDAELFLWNDWGCGSSTLFSLSRNKYLSFYDKEGILRADKDEAFGWFVKEVFELKETKDGFLWNTWNHAAIFADNTGYLAAGNEGNPALFQIQVERDGRKAALELAKKAEKVVVALGCNPVINSKEEVDRTTIDLPPYQKQLIRELYQVNSNIVLVLMTNYPYEIQWEQDELPAILQSATGSQEMGYALANILYGKTVPSGRLPMTWYCSEADLPDIDDYDIIKGRRTYQYFDKKVLYPFGYGLSYTSFSYENLQIELEDNTSLRFSLSIKNIGEYTGDEVVQFYVKGRLDSRVVQPLKKLIGFVKVHEVKPGETRLVTLKVPVKELQYYDVISKSMMVEAGNYQFFAGGSSVAEEVCCTIWIPGEKTGLRDSMSITKADHYDDYENMYLDRAYAGDSCIAVKNKGKKATAVYRDFKWTGEENKLIINMKSEGSGGLKIYLGDCLAAEWKGEAFDKFMNISFPIPNTARPDVTSLRFEAEGSVKITRFWFERGTDEI